MPKIKIGSKAPDFKLEDKSGKAMQLSKLKARCFVVYFYPRDNTPGCTLQAKEFSKLLARFKKRKVAVLGISGGDRDSKQLFCKKNKLSVALLSDPNFETCKAYEVYGAKFFMGRKFKGIKRTTFILNSSKKVIEQYNNVSPEGHAEEILEFVDAYLK